MQLNVLPTSLPLKEGLSFFFSPGSLFLYESGWPFTSLKEREQEEALLTEATAAATTSSYSLKRLVIKLLSLRKKEVERTTKNRVEGKKLWHLWESLELPFNMSGTGGAMAKLRVSV